MNLAPDFTLSELLAYLAEAEESPNGYYTSPEWAERLGVSDKKILAILRMAHRQGKLLRMKQRREAIDGRIVLVPVYAFDLTKEEG